VFDKVVALSHGDGIKSNSFAGIPWYAMKQRQDAMQALLRSVGLDQVDLLCYGHFHQLIFQEGQGNSLIINGSIKGGDEYSIGSRYASQEPVQALVTFHPAHGITDLSRINLGHIR
jgi:predicted phosphodiesterase